MSQTKSAHVNSIDALRGMASLSVVLFHFTGGFLALDNPLRVANSYGYLGVDAFFVISGFVIPMSFAQKKYSILQFWVFFKKRFVRIEMAYWVSIFLMLFKEIASSLISDYRYFKWPDHTFWNIFLHFLHGNDFFNEPWLQAVYWTLSIDWQFYIFVAALFFIIKRPEFWVRYPLYAALVAVKWYFPETLKPWLFYHVMFFLPGIVIFHFRRGFMSKWEFYLILTIIFYYVQLKMGWNHFTSITLSCFIIEFLNRRLRVTAYLGKISYSMYLTHIFSGWWVTSAMLKYPTAEMNKGIAVIIGILVSVIFARLFYEYVEKPTQEWARKV